MHCIAGLSTGVVVSRRRVCSLASLEDVIHVTLEDALANRVTIASLDRILTPKLDGP
jgi:hypothetical protein